MSREVATNIAVDCHEVRGVAPRCLSPDPEKTSARHHHLNVSPRRPAHHRERAVVRLIHLQPYDLA